MMRIAMDTHTLLDAVPDALVIINAEGNIVLFNAHAETMFGYARNELLNSKFEKLITKHSHEQYGIKKNGGEFPLEISLSPLNLDKEMVTFATIRDITVVKKREAKLKGILDATPDALVIINQQGKIILVNAQAEKLFNYSKDEFLNLYIEKLIPQRYRDNHKLHRTKYFENPRVRPMGAGFDLYGIKKDGMEFPIEISLSPLESEEGLLALAAVRDITDRKSFQQDFEEKSSALQAAADKHTRQAQDYAEQQEKFIEQLCHELRNPLSGIRGSLEIITDCLDVQQKTIDGFTQFKQPEELTEANDKMRDSLSDIDICVNHQQVILDRNLDFARMEADKLTLIEKEFDLKIALLDVIRILKSKINKRDLLLNINLPEQELLVRGDEISIKQICINLISNAIKFTPNGSVDIFLLVHEKSSSCMQFEIQVKDTGIGLTEDEISTLFQRFSQVSADNQYSGSGLGLLIAKKLANLMGGDIRVESKKGLGTTFYCTFQCSKILELKPEEEIKMPVFTEKLTILVVDDNNINRKVLGHMLQKTNHIIFAVDGNDAVIKYKGNNFDVILMDIVMPNLDGIAATQQIRKFELDSKLPRVPIIGLSGNALQSQQQQALDAGMDDYATKPYKKAVIFQKIYAHTRSKSPASSSIHITTNTDKNNKRQPFWRSPSPGMQTLNSRRSELEQQKIKAEFKEIENIKQIICEHLDYYINSWRCGFFGYFHHYKRASVIRDAVLAANDVPTIRSILLNQKSLLEKSEGNVPEGISNIIDERWTSKVKNHPKNVNKSGYYQAIKVGLQLLENKIQQNNYSSSI